jgi:hypothetical protein
MSKHDFTIVFNLLVGMMMGIIIGAYLVLEVCMAR